MSCWVCNAVAADTTDALALHVPFNGRTVVAPRRHVASLSLLDDAEHAAVWELALTPGTRALSGTMAPAHARDASATDHAHVCVVPLRISQ